MRTLRRNRRGLTFTGALLLSSAFAAPAFAEIEEVVVTAQKRAEDVQTVPISITAFTGQDLQARQIDQFKDLIFNTPNVSYTKDQFTGSDFQIRGIGYTATGYDAEYGVAVHLDDVYLYTPPLAEATFYDLDRIEVLRGPQSTLYGRGATGGTVNIITTKPELDQFHADLEGSIGNYDSREVRGMVNLPVLDGQLGVRLAGDWFQRDGFVTNELDGRDLDGRNTLSFRASVRWEPTTSTTIDLVGAVEHEGDNRMRSQKQYCTSDPSGILGCLPDSISNGLTNPNSTLPSVASSVQGLNSAFVGTPLAGLGSALGLFDMRQPAQLPSLCQQPGNPCNPSDPRKVYTDFNPQYKANDLFYALNWHQRLSSWLDATLVGGWDQNNVWSQESFTNSASVPFDQDRLGNWGAFTGAEGALHAVLLNAGGPAYANLFAPYFTTAPGSLPLSGIKNLGITGGNILKYVPGVTAYDQSDAQSQQQSLELRFNTNFDGPVNFLLAGYYLRTVTKGDYFVNASTEDYPGIVLGSLNGLNAPQLCFSTGCILSPSFYHNVGDEDTLVSKAVFGEVYYNIIPDELKLTGGLRWTEDEKFQRGRIELFSGLVPIDTTNEKEAMQALVEQGQVDFDQSNPEPSIWQVNRVTFNKLTGRAVIDWTPKLDFTDATLIYASYARGYKAGGFNPGIQPGLGVPSNYLPESVDAFELGTKNTLLGNTLQANLDVWYYDYKDLQVSAIENNTSVNQNINAKLWGVEGEFFWVPTTNWQFNLSFGTTHSEIGNSELVDNRNPTAGRNDVVLIKDATLGNNVGQNCVIYLIDGQTVTPADNAVFQAYIDQNVPSLGGVFFDPPGGSSILAAHGVAHSNFGTCAAIPETLLQPFGYSRIDPTGHGSASGAFVNLRGNQLQNTPDFTISVGAQYTFELGGGYTLVPRADYYWQTSMFGRIFNDAADKIDAWGVGNAQVTLNAPETMWYVTAWAKNIFNKDNITGEYLASSTSGLYTNAFIGDPRTYGLTAGVHF
ncbi:MAG TPA: TonB-dependent receptor [Rhizomicrobium sp.]|jgi:outer membrane receptor protein involved in Fe transport|nr:TonB-dependent receptor [Rhizomicrobium sp.]